MKRINLVVRVFALLLFLGCQKDNLQQTDSVIQNDPTEKATIGNLKQGLIEKLDYQKSVSSKQESFKVKYGKLNFDEHFVIQFHKYNDVHVIVVPLKSSDGSSVDNILACYYKNNKRNYKIFRNAQYSNRVSSYSERAIVENLD